MKWILEEHPFTRFALVLMLAQKQPREERHIAALQSMTAIVWVIGFLAHAVFGTPFLSVAEFLRVPATGLVIGVYALLAILAICMVHNDRKFEQQERAFLQLEKSRQDELTRRVPRITVGAVVLSLVVFFAAIPLHLLTDA